MAKQDFKIYQNLAYLSQIGIIMIVPIFLGLFGGNWLDEKFGTGHVMMIVGIVVGTLAAFLEMIKFTLKIASIDERARLKRVDEEREAAKRENDQ